MLGYVPEVSGIRCIGFASLHNGFVTSHLPAVLRIHTLLFAAPDPAFHFDVDPDPAF